MNTEQQPIVGQFFTYDPQFISQSDIDELDDEDAAMREIHEIRLKMYEERMKQGLSVSDWLKMTNAAK
ncbi:MAG: hypothetical protein FWC50_08880 [Planctomycetaceae bacterium]|nr:hypothetical protein [Planctomycetaceae bacterium]